MAGDRETPFDRGRDVGYEGGMRIVARLLVLLPLLWMEAAWAGTYASYSCTLTSPLEVDDLEATGCETILGVLRVESGTNIISLHRLVNLTSVGSALQINNNFAVTGIDGLVNLISVEGPLFIDSNAALTNTDGLASLTR